MYKIELNLNYHLQFVRYFWCLRLQQLNGEIFLCVCVWGGGRRQAPHQREQHTCVIDRKLMFLGKYPLIARGSKTILEISNTDVKLPSRISKKTEANTSFLSTDNPQRLVHLYLLKDCRLVKLVCRYFES